MSIKSLKIAVLVSAGRHPVSGEARACRGDAAALAFARKLPAEALRVVHYGDPVEPALRDYLACDAKTIEVIEASEVTRPVEALAAAVASSDLVITGIRSEQGPASGMLPYALAHALGRPIVAGVISAMVSSDGLALAIRQFLPKGRRRRLEIDLPAVIAVHPLTPADVKYAFARRERGQIAVIGTDGVAAATVSALAPGGSGRTGSAWSTVAANRPPQPLRAPDTRSGHERMMAAVAADAKGGGAILTEGSVAEKAAAVLDYLVKNRLIEI